MILFNWKLNWLVTRSYTDLTYIRRVVCCRMEGPEIRGNWTDGRIHRKRGKEEWLYWEI